MSCHDRLHAQVNQLARAVGKARRAYSTQCNLTPYQKHVDVCSQLIDLSTVGDEGNMGVRHTSMPNNAEREEDFCRLGVVHHGPQQKSRRRVDAPFLRTEPASSRRDLVQSNAETSRPQLVPFERRAHCFPTDAHPEPSGFGAAQSPNRVMVIVGRAYASKLSNGGKISM
jgi:hypothetical protein